MTEEQKQPEEQTEEQEEQVQQAETETQSEGVDTYFPTAQIVRLIRKENPGKIIKGKVKIGMNKLLEKVATDIAKEMSKKPYSTINYEDFLDAARAYLEIGKQNQERRRVIATLNKIKEDADALAIDLLEKEEPEETKLF